MGLDAIEEINKITRKYNSVAQTDFKINGIGSTAGDYRQIRPSGWPTEAPTVHYEFIAEDKHIYAEIHLEYVKLKDTPKFKEVMEDIIKKCRYPVSKKFSNWSRREREGKDGAMGKGFGLCFSPPYKSDEIAIAMVEFISLTYGTITKILKDAELIEQ